MTSQRRYVIENSDNSYFVMPAMVQSMIPPNLVKISQETKKFIALQILWWGGWWWWGGHQPFFLIYYNLASFLFLTNQGPWVECTHILDAAQQVEILDRDCFLTAA